MKSVQELLSQGINNTKVNILVFGPQVSKISSEERVRNLQNKRIQIRRELENLGHYVKYAEDLVDPNLPNEQGNAFIQEIVIMAEYDLIITLVESPGSIVEAALISSRPNLASKSSLFMDTEYQGGLAGSACKLAEYFGADFKPYNYPSDLVDCHLLTFILERVKKVQLIKLIS